MLLTEYLAIVRPLEIFFSSKFNLKGCEDLKEFLWSDFRKGIWSGDYLSDLLKQYTSQSGMPSLGFQDYRQVATAFMEQHLKYKSYELQKIWDAIYDLQAGHSSKTAGNSYAVGTKDHRSVSRDAMHRFYLVSKRWHELLSFDDSDINMNGQGQFYIFLIY